MVAIVFAESMYSHIYNYSHCMSQMHVVYSYMCTNSNMHMTVYNDQSTHTLGVSIVYVSVILGMI